MNRVFKVGLIGCGHISETYFRAQEYFNNIRIVKCADINMETAKKCAIHYNIEAVTVEELLKDKEIEIILNLTIPRAHFEVSKMALENGKHSYAEKPMAVNFEDGKKLVELAKERNLYIGLTGWICDERRNKDLRKSIKNIPIDKLMIETDAPYLLHMHQTCTPMHQIRHHELLDQILHLICTK